jgi:ketosteroid isomerase-like protein
MEPVTDPVATVRKMFAAFAAGDLDTLLTTIHPDSTWTYVGANPAISNATFTGREAVRAFFERILRRLDMAAFNTDEFIASGETVVVFGSEAGTVRATNRTFRNVWVQKYVVSDGLITVMQEYNIQIEPR